MDAPRLAWIGEDAVAVVTAGRVGAVRVGATDWRSLRRHRVEVLHVRGDLAVLRAAAWAATLGGVGAVVASPTCPPTALPWWERRFHRYLFRSQAEAKAWLPEVPLGRLVVVEPEPAAHEVEALLAVYAEVGAMGRRPGWVRSRSS